MNREIKFRAKRADNGVWVCGDLAHTVKITEERDVPCVRIANYDVDESTIGQYTETRDSTGREIWEGDIVELMGDRYEIRYVAALASFALCDGWDASLLHAVEILKVVGNIHDNPEMLK